jgi:putative SOS response-associated peptidase YedK
MCYDVSFTVDMRSLADYFPDLVFDSQLDIPFDTTHIVAHSYNAHPILYRKRDDSRLHVQMMEWGCIPFYVKDMKTFGKQRATMLNARSERILADQKSYWYKIRHRRCLIPLTGIYEHRAVKGIKNKIPYFVRPVDQPMFFLPGLYSVTELPDVETGEMIKTWSYTLITRPANDLMKMIHNDGDNKWRMPLFLPLEQSKQWVSDELGEEAYQQILDYEIPSERLEAWPVFSIRTTKPRPDGEPKNKIYNWEKLPALGEE